MRVREIGTIAALAAVFGACAPFGMGAIVQPPRFEIAEDRQAELRLLGPAAGRPFGGAAVRLWARVENPNAFGLNLQTLDGTLFLSERQAALVDLPLGLPLLAAADTLIPLDIAISFADVPGLADIFVRVADGSHLPYRLDGRLRVDAGMLGQPTFGPMTLLEGAVQVRR